MSKLKIYKFPDDVLAKKAAPISRVEKELYKLADDMLETMYDAPGVGLAANQIGLLKRIIVIDTEYENEDTEKEAEADGIEIIKNKIIKSGRPIILINPQIIYREGRVEFSEACLSVPEFSADVKRSARIKVSYQNIDGLTKELSGEGLLAVVLQHEIDHLEGKLFIDRLNPLKKEMVKRRLK
ncbi:MAG: hypothetical protein A3K03_10745, partial [Bdellovibrionales bacterium RIFOXYD1_FULL_44_7]